MQFFSFRIKVDSIPNVITPNGDFKNEFFIVDKNESDEVSLLIVNRWGKQVYQSNNDNKNNWNGDELATGIYFYTISGRCVNTVKDQFHLFVELLLLTFLTLSGFSFKKLSHDLLLDFVAPF